MTSVSRRVRIALAAVLLGGGMASVALSGIVGGGGGGGTVPPHATAVLADGPGPMCFPGLPC